jgi:2-polyprenyl-3-methyl-5-hydroxy-6-metoxy-1,4-benzoquinol methylase
MTNGQDLQDYVYRRVHNRIQELQTFEADENKAKTTSVSTSMSQEIPQQSLLLSRIKRKIVVDVLPRFNLTSYRGLLRAYEALARAEATAQQTARERDELARQRDELTRQHDELTRQRDELTRQHDELTRQRDELTRQLDQLRSEHDRLAQINLQQAEHLEKQEALYAALCGEHERFKSESLQRVQEQEALYAALRDEYERFKSESLQRMNDDLIAQNAWLRERLGYSSGLVTSLAEPAEALVHAQLDDEAYASPRISEEDGQTAGENDALYQTLETILRGPRENIKSRQALYLPYLDLDHSALPVVDIGCGRGEFLELMREQNVRVIGVDINDVTTQALVEAGYEAYTADGVTFLQQQPDASLAGITAFQVIEHLPKTALRQLLRVAYAKLAPGGFILLETVNPYCLPVYRTYYLDPTHHEPVPMDLLAILLRFYGFEQLEVFYHGPVDAKLINPGDREIAHRYENYALLGRRPQGQTRA